MNVQSGFRYITAICSPLGNLSDIQEHGDYLTACYIADDRGRARGLPVYGPYTGRNEPDFRWQVVVELWRR